MHELSIAMSIVEIVQEEARRHNARVSAVHLKLGGLSGVVKDSQLFSYGIACDGTELEGSNLVIEEVPVEVFCDRCQANRRLASQFLECPECGSITPAIVHGKELEITAMELMEVAT